MSLSRREFLQALAAAAAAGLPLGSHAAPGDAAFYDSPSFGNLCLLHFTDCHAQLLPVYFREPSANIGVAGGANRPPHLVGEALLKRFGIAPGSREAYAFTHLDFTAAARRYGKLGGFAHLATLVKKLRAERKASVLLDGGDTWQGSATSLWTRGQDMIEAQKLLGVEVTTGHWEFTYGEERVKEVLAKDFAGRIEFLAQNVETEDFGDPVFKPYTLRSVGGVPVAIVGQAFPYTPIAHPRRFVADWRFGIDVILGGHTHDGVPAPIAVGNAKGRTLVTNAGSNGKFLGVLDLEVRAGRISGHRYRLLPVFADLLPPDPAMSKLIEEQRAPYAQKLSQELARTEELLYRRGNFNGSVDQLILDALMAQKDAEIALSPGFRWGTSLLPGEAITLEQVMNQTAITYPETSVTGMTGAAIKSFLEDVCDNLFHPDPYYQQGGDMVRVGGLSYSCTPGARIGSRIGDMRLRGRPIEADKTYKVASWAPVAEDATGEPVWEVLARYLLDKKVVMPGRIELPRLIGTRGNLGAS